MQKQAPTLSRLLVMVIFALSCFGLLLFLWVSFGGSTPLKSKGYRVDVLVGEATQLAAEADVRISGVPVGKVRALRRDGDLTRATLEIKPKYAPLPRNSRVILRQKTLLGETFVELTPGDRRAGTLADGATLPARQSASTVELDEILRALDAQSRKDLQGFIGGIARGTDGRAQDLNDALGTLPDVISTGGDVLEQAAADRRAVAQVVRDAGTIFATVGARDQATRQLITAGDEVLRTTAAQAGDLRRTLRALPGALTALRDAAPAVAPLSAQLTPALRSLQPVARTLRTTLTRAGALGTQLQRTAPDLNAVLGPAKTGLPALRQVVRATGPVLDRLSPLAADLAPVSRFLNLYRNEFTRSWPQVAAATNDTAPTSSGRQAHYLRLILPLWAEALPTSTTRSSTSRANPYPRPGGLERLAQGLESFDCAHTKNAGGSGLPIQTGTNPTCKPMPAFDFDGRTRLFPTLQPDPK
jgi:virulence factor Mce-like protein